MVEDIVEEVALELLPPLPEDDEPALLETLAPAPREDDEPAVVESPAQVACFRPEPPNFLPPPPLEPLRHPAALPRVISPLLAPVRMPLSPLPSTIGLLLRPKLPLPSRVAFVQPEVALPPPSPTPSPAPVALAPPSASPMPTPSPAPGFLQSPSPDSSTHPNLPKRITNARWTPVDAYISQADAIDAYKRRQAAVANEKIRKMKAKNLKAQFTSKRCGGGFRIVKVNIEATAAAATRASVASASGARITRKRV